MMKKGAAIVAAVAGLLIPGAAVAAAVAFTTTDLNIRTGPAASYQRFDTIPEGGRVTVYGCLAGYNWCDVGWGGERGWVSGNYLAYAGRQYARRPIPSVGLTIGLPVIDFSPEIYHRRYYVDRPWYRDRFLDRREIVRDRYFDRRDALRERRELRDARRALREERRDVRDARRELRQERRAGGNIRDERRELRRERRDLREARQDLRRERRD